MNYSSTWKKRYISVTSCSVIELANKPGIWHYSTATDMGIFYREGAPPIAVTLLTTKNSSQEDWNQLNKVTSEITGRLIANWGIPG